MVGGKLAVDCGSAGATAWRALRAATCAGVACCGAAATSPQKPRALMISAGFCGLASAGSAAAGGGFVGCTIWTSAEASWNAEAAGGLERGIRTASADLVSADLA